MADAQKKVEELEAEGTSGGGLVKVKINGKNITTSINIDDSLISKDEKEILEDLIVAALNDARENVQKKIAEEMNSLTGGLKLPPGMKLPF